ncbi:Imm50 family immunity protein [Streptococcus acidominimus]|uniref:Immunity protein 50 n=1 Tax=Streptococcus acidominimus TaxID=1326 RepID=A0A1Q8E6I1_STRAI|nr:Imm50 family immunity protein [Streptococcus acidominimus]MBF0848698.1 hypothetical protein [Streptococcus danieliae]MBF0819879.1 hypothetical protein [Streptococcus acidominimus]MBF0840079.1 hypothetical protein [Streptococcus acidominimus]OLF47400.1 hypothetical protein BU200_10230 [Streptococcus acidominimus]TFU29004.1 hypothetical protein E4U01_10525 [Streptococcus acidominimus]
MWYDNIENTQFLLTLYNDIPKLENIEIIEIKTWSRGQRIDLIFDIASAVDIVPPKWKLQGYTHARLRMTFFNVRESNIVITGDNLKVDADIKEDKYIYFNGSNFSTNISIIADSVYLQSIEGFKKPNKKTIDF